MPFDRGAFSFTMFELTGEIPEEFARLFLPGKAGTLDSVTSEVQVGWVTGKHLLDTNIDETTIVRGGVYSLTLRQAVRKIPASLLNALCQREEQAFLANSGRDYVSGKDRKKIREDVMERHINKMPPALSGIPMVLDRHAKLLFLGATSQTQIDLFIDQFYRATKMEPLQLTPALILDREFHTVPAQFPVLELTGAPIPPAEAQVGRDFLTWLLYYAEKTGKITVGANDFDIMIDSPLLLSGDGEAHGSQEAAIKNGDSPLRSAEVKAALSVGKKLRKAKIALTRDDNSIWSGTFDADKFAFGSFQLPESEEMSPDEIFADRIRALEDFREAWTEYFKLFAKSMLEDFDATEQSLRQWIRDREAI
ncbi:MAG: recombination-associated protein RdgC [Lentisphaeria bacterium]|nr:recombination-associated protein RdgC [Lentisphaeria bacterium]